MAYIRTITFNYNANGGAGAPGSSTSSYNISSFPATRTKGISSTKPSRTYYNFLGWGSSAGATSATWASSQTLSFTWASGDQGSYTMNFYAVWQRQTAYVYYWSNGGSGSPDDQSHLAGTSVTLSATTPTRSGYEFLGWAESSSATTPQYYPNTTYNLYTTVNLYAVWKQASSTLTVSNGTIGTAMTIGVNKTNASYTDGITYQFGDYVGTIVSSSLATSISWTPPLSLASEIPNAQSGTLTIVNWTYDGATFIGSNTTYVTLSVPQSLAPSASVAFADTDATCLGWGIYVQSRSKLSFTITASGQQGATIASYRTTVNGTQYTGATFTTDVLLYNGSNTYTTVVTDSRGLQTTVTGTFNVVAYSVPSLTLTLCDRDDSDDEQINISFDFVVASVSNNNDANYRLDYKLKSSSTWTNGTVTSLGGYSGTITDTIAGRDGGDEWDIRINVIDSFQTASVESEVGVSGNILLNSRHQGGLGILMKSQAQDQLDVGKYSVFHENVDNIQRRCSATLSSAHWYRVLHYEGVSNDQAKGVLGLIIDFDITRDFSHANNETHSIKLMATYESMAWENEVSKSNYFVIDKIRWTYNGTDAYVDIHYVGVTANNVGVCFDVKAVPDACKRITAESLQQVNDAPVGETILSTYTFHANYNPTMVNIWSSVTLNYSELRKDVRVQGGIVNLFLETYFSSYLADYEYTIGTVSAPYRPTYPMFFTGVATDGSFNPRGLILFTIYQNGDLTVRINNTDGNYLILNATYPIDT